MLAFFYFIRLFIMYKIIALLITIFFSSHLFADNNLAEERSMIQNERNNLAIGWRDNLGYDLPKPGTVSYTHLTLPMNREV